MRVLLAVPKTDYGRPGADESYELTSWYGPLRSTPLVRPGPGTRR